jgi:hypothetical protein
MDTAKKPTAASAIEDDARTRLHRHLVEAGLAHLADAVENSSVAVVGAELEITTGKTYKMYLEDRHFEGAVQKVFGKPLRIKITVGETAESAPSSTALAGKGGDDLTSRALAHEEVQRFREVFGGEVRKVRNLKE